ncbi:MAG: hypothetical protein LUG91_05630 [Ruminococcus sp.]|nr:hypothetical protein [Ruminococcus sp.]
MPYKEVCKKSSNCDKIEIKSQKIEVLQTFLETYIIKGHLCYFAPVAKVCIIFLDVVGIFRDSQSLKTAHPISETFSGILIEVRDLQFSKAKSPISVTLSGMVTDNKDVQSEKAQDPIFFTPSGSAIDVRDLQFAKAKDSISVTPFGITISLLDVVPSMRCHSQLPEDFPFALS